MFKVRKSSFILPVAALLLFASASFAAESKDAAVSEVERVEVTGSRLAEEITDVPAPAYVVTREEIENSGAKDVQQILGRIPGINGMAGSSSMAQDKGVFVRGLNSEVLLLVDGVPYMGSSYGTGHPHGSPFDLRAIDISSVERIEVVKGASSAVYGSNAAGGVINIITRKGESKSSGSIKTEGGNNGWFKGSIRGTAVMSDDFKATIGYTKTIENGDVPLRKINGSIMGYATDYRANDYVLMFEKGYWSFLAEVGDFKSEWNDTNSYGTSKYDQDNKYNRFSLNYNDGMNIGRIYYNDSKKDYSMIGTTTYNNYKDSSVGLTFNRKQDIFGVSGIWGVDIKKDSSKFGGGSGNIPYDLSRTGFAPYIEASVPIGEANLDLGLRYEYWNVDDGENVSELIPRVSLNWASSGGQVWYATAGRVFVMPSFYQMFLPMADEDFGIWGKYTSLRNPNLKPEKGWTYDIGVKDEKAKHPWKISVFYMNINDKIDYNSKYDALSNTTTSQYINLNEYRAWGIEGEYKHNFNENWSYKQGVAWTDADEKMPGSDEWVRSDAPRLDLSGILNYSKGPWSAEVAAHYYGDRKLEKFDGNDIFLVNASVAWKNENNTLRISCLNLFDKEFILDNTGYINAERRLVFSWEYKF